MAKKNAIREGNSTPLMRDRLGKGAVDRMAAVFKAVLPGFDAGRFRREALDGLEELELKARVRHLIQVMHGHMPAAYPEAARVLRQIPAHWTPAGDTGQATTAQTKGDPELAEPVVGSFAGWPIIDYTAYHGLEHPEEALPVLETLTPLFSAEFAIRPFIKAHPERTFQFIDAWSLSPDQHVRRLASEGCRPKLPWGQSVPLLKAPDTPAWPILERLKEDPSSYVRRSVANHWNDLSKIHPEMLLDRLESWKHRSAADWSDQQQRTLRHALRTLIKKGHPRALALMGIRTDRMPEAGALRLSGSATEASGQVVLNFGDTLHAECTFHNPSAEAMDVLVDCVLDFRKQNGQLAPKVFKGKRFRLEPGGTAHWHIRRPIKPISTRRHYPGLHGVGLRINGQDGPEASFELRMPDPSA